MPDSSLNTSPTLLEQLRLPRQSGDEEHARVEAWNRFVRLYSPVLFSWAKRQGFQDANADELTQDVLLKLVTELPRYTPKADGSFRGWLFIVTANACRDFRRRKATRPLPPDAGLSGANAEPPLVEFEEAEYRKALIESGKNVIRSEFEERTWAAFEQLMVQNRKAAEVATNLGMTKNAVYVAKNRILTRLRQVIDEFLD